jgi:hypothetical protein
MFTLIRFSIRRGETERTPEKRRRTKSKESRRAVLRGKDRAWRPFFRMYLGLFVDVTVQRDDKQKGKGNRGMESGKERTGRVVKMIGSGFGKGGFGNVVKMSGSGFGKGGFGRVVKMTASGCGKGGFGCARLR